MKEGLEMSRSLKAVRIGAVFALVVAATWAVTASAGLPPSPGNSTYSGLVTLVGLGLAGPDSSLGHCTVTVRDLANNPVAGAVVDFDFSACTDVRTATDQHDPRLSVNCSSRTVTAITGANGVASFTIIGGGVVGPPSPPNSLRIYTDGELLGSPSLAVLDRDGVGGLTGIDLGLWAADLFSGTDPARADFNGDRRVDGGDLSRFAAAFFSGRNTQSGDTYCP